MNDGMKWPGVACAEARNEESAKRTDLAGACQAMTTSGRLEGIAEDVERLEAENRKLKAENRELTMALGASGNARAALAKSLVELQVKFDNEVDRRMAAKCREFADQIDPPKSAIEVDQCPCDVPACSFNDLPLQAAFERRF